MVRSRIALAVVGMLIIGGIAAAVGAASAFRPAVAAVAVDASAGTQTASPAGDSTASATATTIPPAPAPTRTPRPTPTRPPVGVVANLRGGIGSVNPTAGTFVIHEGVGVTDTVQMSAQTTCQGVVTTCAGLQPGMEATVTGSFPSAGAAFQATVVNAQLDH